jgi:FeS assembly protein IscX
LECGGLTLCSRSHQGEITLPPTFDWDDIEDIAISLTDAHPEIDPLTVRFTDMHKWILELPNFSGEAAASNESKLEAIQMAWDEEYKDRKN